MPGEMKSCIYYVMIECRPGRTSPDYQESCGAFVNSWVNAKDETAALDAVADHIQDLGWVVLTLEELFKAERDWYLGESDALKCYEQAARGEIGTIFYMWDTAEE